MDRYQTEHEIEAVIEGFESCRTAGDAFTHRQHLTVAAWYLKTLSEDEALTRMRTGLLRFLTHHGENTTKYNETITLFWLKKVRQCLEDSSSGSSFTEKTNSMLEALASSRMILDYYSEELLNSSTAKSKWVAPNLKPL